MCYVHHQMADVMDKMDRKDASMRKSNQYVADILWVGCSKSVQMLTLLIALAHEYIVATLQIVSYNIQSVLNVVELCMYMASDQQWLR